MKSVYLVGVAMTLAAFAISPQLVLAQSGNAPATTKQESAFACNRAALTAQDRKRHFDELGPALRSMRTGVRELSDGYEFQFPADPKTVQLVAEWAAGERLCCPFFSIELRMEPEGGPMWLRLSGRTGTKDFIKVDGASWIKQ